MKLRPFIFVPCLLIIHLQAQARTVEHFGRSARALLMGDAYTAVADDEFTLFYNPAALSRHSGLSLNFINPDMSISNFYDDRDRFENFPDNDPTAISERFLGWPIHLHFGATPGLKLGSFGFSLLANVHNELELRNAIHPVLDLQYRYDRGFIMGYAFSFGQGGGKKTRGKRKKAGTKKAGNKMSLGIGVKHINRQGIFANYDLFGLELLNKISQSASGIKQIRDSLGYSYGDAWGVDSGFEYTMTTNYSQFNVAFAVLDIGNTQFTKTGGSENVPSKKMEMNFGSSWTQDFSLIDYTVSFDLAPMNQGRTLLETVHLGFELGIPFFSAMWGWNGGYASYGLGVEIWPIKLYGGVYGVELGNDFREEEGKRAVVYVSLLDFSFDP